FTVGRAIRHRCWIKDRNIRVRADTQTSLLPHRRDSRLESLRRQERHLADGVHQRERVALAHVATQHSCERAGGPRMARAVLPVCVARNDRKWTGYRHGDHLLRVGMNDDWSTGPAVPLEAVAIQALARRRP